MIMAVSAMTAQKNTGVLIVYYSQYGHTEQMANAVAEGAREVSGISVQIKKVTDVSKSDLLKADAIIVGSPVHNGNIAVEVQKFINAWPFEGQPLKDKIGAAFVTGGGMSAGEELAQLNILHSMLIFGMIIVGGDDWYSAFGASAITGESPFEGKNVNARFLEKGKKLGKRVAKLAKKIHAENLN